MPESGSRVCNHVLDMLAYSKLYLVRQESHGQN
jgi:hypothetical protein